MDNEVTLKELLSKVPKFLSEDVSKRVNDWLVSGGNIEDDYITKQIIFLDRYIEFNKNN